MRNADWNAGWDALTKRDLRYDAMAEIRAISSLAEHFVRNQEITGADALLRAIDVIRSVDATKQRVA